MQNEKHYEPYECDPSLPVSSVEAIDVDSPNKNGEQIPIFDQQNEQQDEETIDEQTSSFENIIPIDKLQNGWLTMSGYFNSAVMTINQKALETYNSEPVQNFRKKTGEVVGPVWEKTRETTTPYWEKTREFVGSAAENTRQNINLAAERAKPTLDTVRTGRK
jgi:hypothetical protein